MRALAFFGEAGSMRSTGLGQWLSASILTRVARHKAGSTRQPAPCIEAVAKRLPCLEFKLRIDRCLQVWLHAQPKLVVRLAARASQLLAFKQQGGAR